MLSAVATVAAFAEPRVENKIAETAKDSLGKEMWKGYGLRNGFLGCAAAVSNVLNKAGIKDAHSAGVVLMRNQLLKSSNKTCEFVLKDGSKDPIDEHLLVQTAEPGDVLLAFMDPPSKPNTGGNAHCGIMSEGPFVYTNDWNDGIWKRVNIHQMFDYYRHVRLLRILPAKKKT
jgi:hypothetical protein